MKKNEVVKSHEDFNEVINKGIKKGNKYFLLFAMQKKEERPHFGIAVGKSVGNAVKRNKFKRQIRNIIDNNKLLFKNSYNYIIIVKKDCVGLPYNSLEEKLIDLIRKDTHEK